MVRYDRYTATWDEYEEREEIIVQRESLPPTPKITVKHLCGHERTVHGDLLSPAMEEFCRMVETSLCRECRKRQRVGRAV